MRPLIEHEPDERLPEDDVPTRREEEFRALALRQQEREASRTLAQRGVCTNCREQCMPLTVYCDPYCRDDHEARLAAGRV